MSRLYKPTELGFRVSLLLCMGALSGIASGPIAFAATYLEGTHGLHGWQYLFIMEGVPTIALSLLSYIVLFDDVDSVRWLTEKQKALQKERMEQYKKQERTPITWRTFRVALLDYKTWFFAIIHFLTAISLTSINVFAPIIIEGTTHWIGYGYS